ncbi:Na+/H+ antiporter subunit E [Candidatus Aerophobetes bacterium]|nr:Na+/H+ antiporter subunit E [Candidatus Aerophobetes bacterium]
MKKLVLFIVSFITWLILTWTVYLPSLLIGVGVSLIVSFWFADIFIRHPQNFFQIKRFLYLLLYIPIFIFYCIVANLDVAYRVLHPKLPIEPGIVKVKTELSTLTGRVALANSITLTPGTLTVELTDDGYLYVHWINVKAIDVEEATKMIVKKFEPILKEVFG